MKDIYNRQYEVWLYDLYEPEEKMFVGRKPPRKVPFYALKFPDYLIGNAPPEITDQELFQKNKKFLSDNGIDL